jgi:hypothetical protein
VVRIVNVIVGQGYRGKPRIVDGYEFSGVGYDADRLKEQLNLSRTVTGCQGNGGDGNENGAQAGIRGGDSVADHGHPQVDQAAGRTP